MGKSRLVAGLLLVAALGAIVLGRSLVSDMSRASKPVQYTQPAALTTQTPAKTVSSQSQTATTQTDQQLDSESAATDQGLNQLDQDINQANQSSSDDGGY